jgi:hypothetical protein
MGSRRVECSRHAACFFPNELVSRFDPGPKEEGAGNVLVVVLEVLAKELRHRF